jgi:hypothetical protein
MKETHRVEVTKQDPKANYKCTKVVNVEANSDAEAIKAAMAKVIGSISAKIIGKK